MRTTLDSHPARNGRPATPPVEPDRRGWRAAYYALLALTPLLPVAVYLAYHLTLAAFRPTP